MAIGEYPEQAEPYRVLAAVLSSRGANVEAEAAARRAVELRPDSADMVYMLSSVYRNQGRHREAQDWAIRGLVLATGTSAEALRDKGQLLLYLGKPAEAIAPLKASLAENPFGRRARDSLANAYMYLGRYEDAGRENGLLLLMFPDYPSLVIRQVRMLLACGRIDEAERFSSRAPQFAVIDPWFAELGANMALLRRDGRVAVLQSERARDLAPTTLAMAVMAWLAKWLEGGEQAAISDLRGRTDNFSDDVYVRGTIDFLLGNSSEQALLVSAESTDEQVQRNQLCETYYLLGMRRILSAEAGGPNADADLAVSRDHFVKCLETGVKGYTEYIFARLELERLTEN